MLYTVFLTLTCALAVAQINEVDNRVSQNFDLLIEANKKPICELSVFNRTDIKDSEDEINEADDTKTGDAQSEISQDNALEVLVDFPSLNAAVSNIKNQECREQGLKVLIGLLLRKPWALQMFNASAKSFEVLFSNSSYDLGDFDNCFNIIDGPEDEPIETQYCLASIVWKNIKEEKKVRTGRGNVIRWAICVPKACRSDDVTLFISDVLSRTTAGNSASVEVFERNCSSKRPIDVNLLDVAFLMFCLLLGVMLVMGTLYDWINCGKQNKSVGHHFIMSFSMISNIKKIGCTEQNDSMGLEWVGGVKTIAMMLTLGGHAALFILSGPVRNPEAWDKSLRHPMSSIILSNHFLVDTFFFLSAFLFSYLLLVDLEKKRGKVNMTLLFIFRYIRMTPSYMFVMLFYMTWFPKIGEGPLWNDKLLLEQDRCMHSWWANLLFINNYVHTDTICMFQSWYLAVDTQLALVAPFFIYSLWRWSRAAPRILAISITISGLIPAVTTYVYQLDCSLLFYAKEFSDFASNVYFKEAYIKTELRIVTYVMGIAAGYILHLIRLKKYVFSRNAKVLGWAMSIMFIVVSTLPLTLFYQDWYEYNAVEAAAYVSLQKLIWGIVNGWFMLTLTTGGGGWIRCFLTWKLFVPISKLTFSAYLMNIVIELIYVGRLRYPLHVTPTSAVSLVFAHIMLTFVAAFLFCLIFEFPLHGILKVIFSRLESKKDNQIQPQSSNETEESTKFKEE